MGRLNVHNIETKCLKSWTVRFHVCIAPGNHLQSELHSHSYNILQLYCNCRVWVETNSLSPIHRYFCANASFGMCMRHKHQSNPLSFSVRRSANKHANKHNHTPVSTLVCCNTALANIFHQCLPVLPHSSEGKETSTNPGLENVSRKTAALRP